MREEISKIGSNSSSHLYAAGTSSSYLQSMNKKLNHNHQTPKVWTSNNYVEKFSDELQCRLCRRILSEPVALKKCLHRFCAECIDEKILRGVKSCPIATCRKTFPVGSKPFFKDRNFRAITSKILISKRRLYRRTVADVVDTAQRAEAEPYSNTLMDNVPSSSSSFLPTEIEPSYERHANHSKDYRDLSGEIESLMVPSIPQRIHRDRTKWLELILWPDGSVFRELCFSSYLRKPHYIYVTAEATIGHIVEFLWRRCSIQSYWHDRRSEYRIELCLVEEERSDFNIWVYPSRSPQIPGLSLPGHVKFSSDNSSETHLSPFMLVVRPQPSAAAAILSNLFIRHPFQALRVTLPLAEILQRIQVANSFSDESSILKLMYRFVRINKTQTSQENLIE